MLRFFLILLCTLKISLVLCPETTPSTSSSQQHFAILPMVLIRHENLYLYPNKLEDATIKRQGFTGDTQFSHGDLKDQLFFCPASSKDDKALITKANTLLSSSEKIKKYFENHVISENCLINKQFRENEILQCVYEAIPTITREVERNGDEIEEVLCGPGNRGKLYKFIYDLCPPITFAQRSGWFLLYLGIMDMMKFMATIPFTYEPQKVYEICYDHKRRETIYTKHQLRSLHLLSDERLQNEKYDNFPLEISGYGYFDWNFYADSDFYKQQSRYLVNQDLPPYAEGADLPHNPPRFVFEPQFLVPADDMAMALWRKTTYHLINIRPMHEDLMDLWNYIQHLMRNRMDDEYASYDIYTGAFKLSQTPHNKQIPDIWIKIIWYQDDSDHEKDISAAIVMKNNSGYDTNLSDFCPRDYCSSYKNEPSLQEKFPHLLDYFRCCKVTPRIMEMFGIHLDL